MVKLASAIFPPRDDSDGRKVQALFYSFKSFFQAVYARVHDGVIAVQVRDLLMQCGDLSLDGSETLLDRRDIVLHLGDAGANRAQVLENQVFGAIGHGGPWWFPLRSPF